MTITHGTPRRVERHLQRTIRCLCLALVLLGVVALQLTPGAAPTLAAHTHAVSRPNVVIVMLDDADVPLLQALIAANRMPNLVGYVLNRGITASHANVVVSQCCPSRASTWTGQMPQNNHVKSNAPPQGSALTYNDSATLFTAAQSAGYWTGYIGKYLNGYGEVDINHDGVVDQRDVTYVPPGMSLWDGLIDPSTYDVYNWTVNQNGTLYTAGSGAGDYQTTRLQQYATTALQQAYATGQPFLLSVNPLAPHNEVLPADGLPQTPHDIWLQDIRPAPQDAGLITATTTPLPPTPRFNAVDANKPPWVNGAGGWPALDITDTVNLTHQYDDKYASVFAVDRLIGAVGRSLQQAGKLSSTVFIVMSDNGFMYGDWRIGNKIYPYTVSAQIPFYISVPWLPATFGTTLHQIILNTDVAPTVAQLIGATLTAPPDGTSFVPLLSNPSLVWRQRFSVQHFYDVQSGPLVVRRVLPGGTVVTRPFIDPDYAATVGGLWADPPTFDAVTTAPDALSDAHALYVHYPASTAAQTAAFQEYYDLAADPNQLGNAASDPANADAIARLSLYSALLATCGNGVGQTSCHALEFSTAATPPLLRTP